MSAVSSVFGSIRVVRRNEGRVCPPHSQGRAIHTAGRRLAQRGCRQERSRGVSRGRPSCALVLFLSMIVGTSWTALATSGLVPHFTRSAPSDLVPLEVRFDASSSLPSGGRIAQYQWSFG